MEKVVLGSWPMFDILYARIAEITERDGGCPDYIDVTQEEYDNLLDEMHITHPVSGGFLDTRPPSQREIQPLSRIATEYGVVELVPPSLRAQREATKAKLDRWAAQILAAQAGGA